MTDAPVPRVGGLREEVGRLAAFARRDLLVSWSYRAAFFGDVLNLVAQIAMFYYVGRMVNPGVIPSYGGRVPSYIGFVTVGIALGAFLQLGLGRLSTAIRQEQLMGTLESLLMTPTRPVILQVGLAVYDLLYVPVRTFIFLGAVMVVLDVQLHTAGFLPALVILLLFIPFVWGLGMVAGAGVLTFRRGGTILGIASLAVNITSGAYFPLTLFPTWVQRLAVANPVAVAFESTRQVLLGNAGWAEVGSAAPVLVIWAVAALVAGAMAVRLAMERELRRGSLAQY